MAWSGLAPSFSNPPSPATNPSQRNPDPSCRELIVLSIPWCPGTLLQVGLAASEALCVCAKSFQLCLTLCDPKDCSSPGSSVQEILQARILEWIAMPSSRGSSRPRD